ncbi:hypothetical protein WJX72_002719 [[Myrmecia] bisecta]|uniref:Uncharacterized protein n=1 Tax=[Myrmecia] bisecta TaxID=41462 RepID=A0AAW1Q194_9CHLO
MIRVTLRPAVLAAQISALVSADSPAEPPPQPNKPWQDVDGDLIEVAKPDLYTRLVQLVRHVYKECNRTFQGIGYYHMIKLAYKPADPSTSYIQIAEGLRGLLPGGSMVFSISTRYKSVKNKTQQGQPHERLGTTKYNSMLKELNTWVHATHAQRLEARQRSYEADQRREKERREQQEKQREEQAQQREKQREEQAQQRAEEQRRRDEADKAERRRKVALLQQRLAQAQVPQAGPEPDSSSDAEGFVEGTTGVQGATKRRHVDQKHQGATKQAEVARNGQATAEAAHARGASGVQVDDAAKLKHGKRKRGNKAEDSATGSEEDSDEEAEGSDKEPGYDSDQESEDSDEEAEESESEVSVDEPEPGDCRRCGRELEFCAHTDCTTLNRCPECWDLDEGEDFGSCANTGCGISYCDQHLEHVPGCDQCGGVFCEDCLSECEYCEAAMRTCHSCTCECGGCPVEEYISDDDCDEYGY